MDMQTGISGELLELLCDTDEGFPMTQLVHLLHRLHLSIPEFPIPYRRGWRLRGSDRTLV
jgi:hypothetical protein